MPTDQVSVSDQLLVRGHNRIACDLQLPCQLSTRRQLHTRWEHAIDDAVDKFLANLRLQIHRIVRIYVYDGVLHATNDNPKLSNNKQ